MDYRKDLLLRSAARLYSLGVDLEGAKDRIRRLAEAGTDYGSPEMVQAVSEYSELKQQWDALEQEHLKLRAEIMESEIGR